MKNKLSLLSGLLALMLVLAICPAVFGAYEYTIRVKPYDVDERNRNFLVDYDQETWLIHYGLGCDTVSDNKEVVLVAVGELDGSRDSLRTDAYHSCTLDQAERITGKLLVTKVSQSDTDTEVRDENDTAYRIYYSSLCHAIRGLDKKYIYYYQFGYQMDAGDMLFLPDGGESCALRTVQRVDPLPDTSVSQQTPAEEGRDIKKPSTPANLRAIPSKNAVYLYWQAASDDVGISHYIINASLSHTVDQRVQEPGDLAVLGDEFVTPTNRTSFKLEDLLSDELYFFRIAAVDTSGNTSSYWSQEATAMTKSSIAQVDLRTTPLRIFQPQETDRYFLLRWNYPASADTFTVTLDVDEERVYSGSEHFRPYIKVLKKSERKGKIMKLVVRTHDIHGQAWRDEIEFSF